MNNILSSSSSWVSSLTTDNSLGCSECAGHLPCFICLVMLSRRLNILWQSLQLYVTSVSCTTRLCWSSFRRRVKCFLHGIHTSGLRGARSPAPFFLRVVLLVLVLLDGILFRLLSISLPVVWLLSVSITMLTASVSGFLILNTPDCSVPAPWSSADINISSSEQQNSNRWSTCS